MATSSFAWDTNRRVARHSHDVRLVHELMVGPLFYRVLFSGGPVDRKVSTSLVDAILDAFAPDGRGTRGSKRRPRR